MSTCATSTLHRVVFLADVNATAEAEIFMLRNVVRITPAAHLYNTPPSQLIMRNRGPDRPADFEVCLTRRIRFAMAREGT